MSKETEIVLCIKSINKQVLRSLETEMKVLKIEHPSLEKPIDSCYQRMRQHVLNNVGDCVRFAEKEFGIDTNVQISS